MEDSKPIEGKPPPPKAQFWLQLGEELVKKSVDVYEDRSKTMITASGALATLYLGLLKLLDIKISTLSPILLVLFVLPQILFVLSTLSFVVAILPTRFKIDLINVQRIKETYITILKEFHVATIVGYALFICGLFGTVIVSILVMIGAGS